MPYSPLDIANAFIQTGEIEEARTILLDYLLSAPADDQARRLLISVMMRLPNEPNHILQESERIAHPTAEDFVERSILYERDNRLAEAAATMQAALEQQPQNEWMTERLVHLLRRTHDFAGAAHLVGAQPQTWRWLQQGGDLAVEQGDYAAAYRCYTAALVDAEATFAAHDPWGRSLRARLLLARAGAALESQRLDEAAADYDAAAALIPGDPLIPFNQGLVAALRGDIASALTLCGAALSAANPEIQIHMETTLRADARYAALAALLLQGESDV